MNPDSHFRKSCRFSHALHEEGNRFGSFYRPPGTSAGFSLMELLVVMAIIAIMAACSVSIFASTMKGGDLGQGLQFLNDQFTLARQTALAKNKTVEVRLYQYASTVAGEPTGIPASGKFRAVQIFLISNVMTSSGQWTQQVTPLEQVKSLPPSMIMDSNATLSPLLGSSSNKGGLWSATDPQVSIPQAGTSYNCRYFQFYPDGSTNLTSSGSLWFVTLHANTAGDNRATPPADFATVEVDPINGHVQIFRP